MKISSLLLGLAALASACNAPSTDANPRQLWITLNGSERAIQLVPMQPDPF